MKSFRTHPVRSKRLLAFCSVIWFLNGNRLPAQTYTITELPPLAGDTYCGAYALNEAGQAAGYSRNRAVIWTNGVPLNIHGIADSNSVAFALNDSGHAAGDVSSNGTASGGFIWRGAFMQRILPPAGQYILEAYAMNNSGAIVGIGGSTFGYLWKADTYLSLGLLPGDYSAYPYAINDLGTAAGRSHGPIGDRPVKWIGSLPQVVPLPAGAAFGVAWGINDLSAVVGEFYPGADIRPFVWSSSLGAQALPLPAGATSGYAVALNNAGLIIGDADRQPIVWRKDSSGNYMAAPVVSSLTNGTGWSGLTLYAINEAGQIAGDGEFNGKTRGFILTPGPSLNLVLRTDANRDGTTDFDKPADTTAPGRPFYFWTNDDHDDLGMESVNGSADSADLLISTTGQIRDLEDFARLAFNLTPELRIALDAGATLTLEAKGAGQIHLFSIPNSDTETDYLTSEAFALSLVTNNTTNTALPSSTLADSTTWLHLESLITTANWTDGRLRFLWEGVTPGACILTLHLIKSDGAEIVSTPVHLSLRPVREFFEHVRATPENGFPPPYETNGLVPPMDREVVHSQLATPFDEQNVDLVWVHGWRLTDFERQNWAEMMFKRLWHSGYRGRLHAFTWPTLSGDDPLVESGPDGKLSYDRSEFRAWKSGAALENYLRVLRNLHSGGRLAIVSHSMGNVVTGEALRRGAPADLQIMMQAALPAGCYDIRTILDDPGLLNKESHTPTPDFDVELGYRGFLSHVTVPTISYYNAVDFALQTGTIGLGIFNVNWVTNQGTKPDNPTGKGAYEYRDLLPGFYSNKKLLRAVTDVHESLAFLARSRTRAVGAEPRTQFPQAGPSPNVNLEHDFNFARDSTEHSAQFNRPIQRQLIDFYSRIVVTVSPVSAP